MSENHSFSTLAIHAGQQADTATGACATPIYQTTSFEFKSAEQAANLFNLQEFGNIYSRLTNPTVAVLEERVAALEGGVAALAVSSGHAAQFTVFHTLLEPGDEILAANKLYGGSINQMGESFKKFGWKTTFVDPTAESFKAAMN
ncbi:MAG: PLP-dependent transferase, partial [Emcibacter sp.]|nr:PLP-dependent transferase [Emcibacter sp.]